MEHLERLQVLTELVREFKTALMMDDRVEEVSNSVIEIIAQVKDPKLNDFIQQAYTHRKNSQKAIPYLDHAITYLHNQIDQWI